MLQFYYNAAPNPMKVALFLEESGLPYEAIPVDTRKGDQFSPDYVAINPNSKAPSIVDDGKPVFDLERHPALPGGEDRPVPAEAGPCRGDAVLADVHRLRHRPLFRPVCPFQEFRAAGNDYGVKRYEFEAKRHWGILNDRLEGRDWVVGDSYSFVDMAAWGWERLGGFVLGAEEFDKLANVKRHLAAINARPAAARAEAIKTRHAFKAEMDDEARKIMFRHTAA